MRNSRVLRVAKIVGVITGVAFLAGLYWYGAIEQLLHVNTDMNFTDQHAYMNYARNLYESDYTFVSGRNQMPLYPFFQSLFYRSGMTEDAFFSSGKYINVTLSFALLSGLALIFRQFFSWLYSLNLLLIVAFTVFIFKAGYFQTELLFYFLNFCLFLLMWRLLKQMSWKLAILTGIVAGIAHLTKASVLPSLGLFLVLALIKWGIELAQALRQNDLRNISRSSFFPSALLVGLFFLLTIFPYINTSKRVFGHYFYNVNSTFYMWYDSWEDVQQGTKSHGDRVGWPDMPDDEIPSMSKYLHEHTITDIAIRIGLGAWMLSSSAAHSFGYYKYVLIYLYLLATAVLISSRQGNHSLFYALRSNPILYIFLILYFAGYFVLYSFYTPIAAGQRFILSQFIPLMFIVAYGIYRLVRVQPKIQIGGKYTIHPLLIINLFILSIITSDIYFILTDRISTMYGGN